MKLKQKLALGLCIFYLVSVIGVALSLHFCGGELSAVHFTQLSSPKGCGMEKAASTSSCCKNTSVDAKIKDCHQSGVKTELPKTFSVHWFLPPFLSDIFDVILPKLFSKVENKAPPFSSRIALHVFNCVFRN
ncbi:hypothetical protein [Pedobacter sp. L105]|uniref:HYC_CC_PP family protein n=1 Tax=Pedobacter sp. L105 TaxID=1641871 RepID=UPI00131D2BDD|nr:hypothetical protein [Pedobacter sp. L105]